MAAASPPRRDTTALGFALRRGLPVLLASVLTADVAAVARDSAGSSSSSVLKASRLLPKELVEAQKLDAECAGCYPENRAACSEDVWNRCCSQEISCHEYHCLEEVLGTLQANTKVRAREQFTSNDEEPVTIAKGTSGKVIRVDSQGDALIKFTVDEVGEEVAKHWVFREEAWKFLELPERMVRHQAAKLAKCLDKCVLEQSCNMLEIQKFPKKMKKYEACMKKCKPEECRSNEECGALFHAYATCKPRIHQSGECSPRSKASGTASSEDERTYEL